MKIPIRLGAYAERRRPLSGESRSYKLIVVAAIGVVHLLLVSLWWIAPTSGPEAPEFIRQIRFFDIAIFPTAAERAAAAGLPVDSTLIIRSVAEDGETVIATPLNQAPTAGD